MATHTFSCIDGHTCGNPVRLVSGGGPRLDGADHAGEARPLPARVRLDPHRPDVRAARPRHDVGLDPLSADPAGLRRGGALHRDLRLPADVRPRHHRHRHHGHRERPHHPARAGQARHRHAGRQGRDRLPPGGPLRRGGAPDQRPRLPPRRGADRRGRGAGRDRRSTSPTAATSTPSSSRRRTSATWPTTPRAS